MEDLANEIHIKQGYAGQMLSNVYQQIKKLKTYLIYIKSMHKVQKH